MGKRVKMIQQVIFQGTTIPANTIVELVTNKVASGVDSQTAGYGCNQSSSSDVSAVILQATKGGSPNKLINFPIDMTNLSSYISDVAVGTPLTVL